ncbi:MAG TPA: carboxyl transferase domain-containing protein [Solirubrobacteraceae bacterium]|nr:carboxyl transferase domain-containing protein [Solirubrobacteraceae bacterium]
MTPRPFTRLAIVNRGEPAMRLIHAVRELNRERGGQPIRLIALHTEAEREAMFVRHADEAVALGPGGYLDHGALRSALRESGADAVWVGWGFVAEQAEFAELCDELGIVFVGPGAGVMRRVGDKIAAKRLAEEADVPVALWSGGPVQDAGAAMRHAARIGFPLMIKASAGGGGRGIRRVDRRGDIPAAFAAARAEAMQAFGDGTMLLERLITPARHIEVQVIADGHGTAWALGLRDCTYQRRNQKVIEESASPALSGEQEHEVMEAARRLALRAGYRNAGTVEFLYDPVSGRFSFMEVNARLQVEHPVTEAVTGVDLVKLQLHIAAGGRLDGEPPQPAGHAVEARLNAEDPALGFAPAPGRIAMLRLPTGPGVRVDTGVAEGDVIPPDFDSMIAKVIAWGRDRAEALARLRRALADTMVVIEGGTTNQGFLLALLDRPELRTGDVDTTWLDRLHLRGEIASLEHADVALLQAAVELSETEIAADRARFYAFARRGRPQAAAALARTVELRHRGQTYRLAVAEVAPHRHRVTVDGESVEVVSRRLGVHERRLEVHGRVHRTLTSLQGTDLLVEVDGVPHRIARDDAGLVRNLAPAVVVSIPVVAGDEVEAGDVVAVVESMKMESSLTAPCRGRVRRVLVSPNVHVGAHEPLLQLEPDDDAWAATASTGDRVTFAAGAAVPAPDPRVRCLENLRRLEWLILGYDVASDEVRSILDDLHGECADLSCHPALVPGEHRLLGLYADVRALTDPRHDDSDPEADVLRSPEQHLHAFLRSLDSGDEGLPPRFTSALERALAHYGVASLDRTPALEDACYRLFLAQARAEAGRAAVLAILDRRLELAGEPASSAGDEFRHALDRLVAAAERRDPIVGDLARRVRFRYFDEPVIETAREQVYAAAAAHLDALAADPARADRDERLDALVACPRPLAPTLAERMHGATGPFRSVLLETIARRFYRVRDLGPFAEAVADGQAFLTTQYRHEGSRRRLITAFAHLDALTRSVRAFADLAADVPDGELAVGDFYVRQEEDSTIDELAATIRAALAGVALPARVHRVVVAVTRPGMGRGMNAMVSFTFRPGSDGLAEDSVLRGIHPMMAERLRLGRLSEFSLERLAAAEDVYFFHGVARTNPRDERLFAVAEVRDLTPVRDADGAVTGLPELERVLVQALEAIRGYQSHRKPSRRLQWNRIVLHAWPVIDLAPEEIRALVGRLAPSTEGLGIEMVLVHGRVREPAGGARQRVLRFFAPGGGDVVVEVDDVPTEPLRPLDEGVRRLVAARRRGLLHPAEIVKLLAPAHGDAARANQAVGEFVEHDLDDHGELVAVARAPALNPAGIVVGLIRNFTERHPEGMLRVALFGDPTKALGSLAEAECRRIIAALDMAERLQVPVEWFALSAGAKIAMDSGTENMDWIAAVLRRIIEFTQGGGELNVVVTGINVGAQPYWNAEATMLMHTKGVLVMTPQSAMVLTGKEALDYSGGVSAEDNLGIGGYERIMGPNGQAQYWAPDVAAACRLLLDYYEHTYVAPGERFPRRARTSDPAERDIASAPHRAPGSDLACVGEVFSDAGNPGRKKPFDMRSVMRAVADADRAPLERWAGMRDAEIAVVWDAHLGGWPVSMIGIESRPLARKGMVPADGPEQWTPGTLFPRASKKVARALNAASGRRPAVVLANLAGFDGSPESMREWQLEFGAEIGRAVVNFDGPIVFCVVSRYHGGAFVVFSQRLNEQLEAVALEGAHASVIGGAPAAAVVFARDVEQAAARDERIVALDGEIAAADGAERVRLRARRAALWDTVLAEHRGAFAAAFDNVHSVERAVDMGSVSGIIAPARLRPYLIDAVDRGIRRTLERTEEGDGNRMAHGVRG